MRILIIDNYDSFTFNLVHQVEKLTGNKVAVMMNDIIDWQNVEQYDKIILSPGPGLPIESGSLMEFINRYINVKPILGVCLGQQAIASHFGATLQNLNTVFHGMQTVIEVDTANELYKGLSKTLAVGRYHSWVVDPHNLPGELKISGTDTEGQIMSLSHASLPCLLYTSPSPRD